MKRLRVSHQFIDSHPFRQFAFFRQVADASENRYGISHRVESEDAHGTALSFQKTEDVLDHRGLSRTVRAHETMHATTTDLETHSVKSEHLQKLP